MAFPIHIFKAYDIRGLADSELTGELAYRIGRGFVAYLRNQGESLKDKKIVVGRDMRPTSPMLQAEVMRGIQEEGVAVVDIGMVSTPLFNFACSSYPDFAGGIMVTASHNPAQYNGFKLTLSNALPVSGKAMYEWVEKIDVSQKSSATAEVFNPLPDYLNTVFSIVPAQTIKPLRAVIDFGNGMGIVTFQKLLEALPQIQVTFLYSEPDGTFPNHEANPLKTETLKDLQNKVIEVGADFGFALDGDCDRIGLVDGAGQVVEPSYVAALIGTEVLRAHPGIKMAYDVRSSISVKETWEAAGGRAEHCMIGHALIKKFMLDRGVRFASELSLHLFYGDLKNIESGDLSLLYVLQILSRNDQKLNKLVVPLKKYFHSGEINFEVEDKEGVMQKIEEKYKNTALEISHLDGLWMLFEWGWFSVRASNTEPVLRLNLEAKTSEEMHEQLHSVTAQITV